MNVIYAKIWADLWHNKSRTIQIVLIVAFGAVGVGLTLGARSLTSAAVNADWVASAPPVMKLSVDPPLAKAELIGLESIDGVLAAEGFAERKIEWRASPDEPWRAATLSTRADYTDQQMSLWDLEEGEWPRSNGFAVERGYDEALGLKPGTVIETRINDRVRPVTMTGVLNNREVTTGFIPEPTFYASHRRYAEITEDDRFSIVAAQLDAFDAEGRYDPVLAGAIDGEVQERLEKLDIDSQGLKPSPPTTIRVDSPEVHFANGILSSVFFLLGAIGAVIIVLGILLVYTNVSALITQQVGQIGVMKAIGASTRQILRVYLILILIYGVLASLISVPLAVWAAHGIKLLFLTLLDANGQAFAVDYGSVLLQVLVIFGSLLVASLRPLLKGARLTVREAVSTYGLGGAAGLLDTLIVRAKNVSYTVLLMIGNTFRNVARLSMTQVVLVGSGVLFIAVMGVNDSVRYTFGPALREIHRYEITYTLQKDARSARLEQLVLAQPNVQSVETWNSLNGSVRPQSQSEHLPTDERATVFGMPLETAMYVPDVRAGRWLQPGDEQAVTVHEELALKLGVEPGDRITLRTGAGDESDWAVIGTFFDPARDNGIYMAQSAFAGVMNVPGKSNTLFIKTIDASDDAVTASNVALKQFLEESNLSVVVGGLFDVTTIAEITARRLQGMSVLISLLSIMVLVVAIVGGIGLSGTLSLSVMERTREIGVMRAIGASSWRITGLFVGEGLVQAILSWILATPLGVAGAYLLSAIVLSTILGDELIYIFRPTGIVTWLVVMVLLGTIASWLPARRATKVSVRESLAYQ